MQSNELCANISRRRRYEHDNQLNIEPRLADDTAELQPVPEVHYEICHPKPLAAHRCYYDYTHLEKFSTFYFRVIFHADFKANISVGFCRFSIRYSNITKIHGAVTVAH